MSRSPRFFAARFLFACVVVRPASAAYPIGRSMVRTPDDIEGLRKKSVRNTSFTTRTSAAYHWTSLTMPDSACVERDNPSLGHNAINCTIQLTSALGPDACSTGIRAGPLGLDFQRMLCSQSFGGSPLALSQDARVKAVVGKVAQHSVSEYMFEKDAPHRFAVCSANAKAIQWWPTALKHLHENGYVKIDDWGIDMVALRAQAFAALRSASATPVAGGTILRSRTFLPALAPLLRNETTASLLKSYFGTDVRLDGWDTLHLGQTVSDVTYASAKWHHDRCGKRVKLFIFLHDIHEYSRPTVIARGSHHVWYRDHLSMATSRVPATFVHEHYDTIPMLGKAGGGFIFDTNALHRGEHRGDTTRTTVILEFHAHHKIPQGQGHAGFNQLPCPSNWKDRSNHTNKSSVPGYPLYPFEA